MHCVWRPAPHNLFKINVDGAVSLKQGCSAIEMVIRDWNGKLRVARACPITQLLCLLATELIAIREALNWYWNTGYCMGAISTDSRVVVKFFTHSSSLLGLECFLVDQIKSLLSTSVQLYCNCAPRSSNSVAHSLAKYGLSLQKSALWWC